MLFLKYYYNMKDYNNFAESFSKTRDGIWKEVEIFLNSLEPNSLILDAGCGNGKNMIFSRKDLNYVGFDSSNELIKICKKQNLNVFEANILNIPIINNYFDNTICIAVIHHLKTFNERLLAIQELIRVTKKGGRIFITLWQTFENSKKMTRKKIIDLPTKNDFLVPWGQYFYRYYHLFDENEIISIKNLINVLKFDYTIKQSNWNIEIIV